MSKRVVIFIGLVALVAAESHSDIPGFPHRASRKPATKARTIKRVPSHILRSPEKMTELFGPSILMRDTVAEAKPSKFVTQPE